MQNLILFLDFDGPVFNDRALSLMENISKEIRTKMCEKIGIHPFFKYWKFDPVFVDLFEYLNNKYDLSVVISSSWADPKMHNFEQIQSLFRENKLDAKLHTQWSTPRNRYFVRSHQIRHWLINQDLKDFSNYLVLDDPISGSGLDDAPDLINIGLIEDKIVLVDSDKGLSNSNIAKVKHMY